MALALALALVLVVVLALVLVSGPDPGRVARRRGPRVYLPKGGAIARSAERRAFTDKTNRNSPAPSHASAAQSQAIPTFVLRTRF